MSHRHRNVRVLTLALLVAFAAGNAAAQQCTKKAQTNVVYVKFDGCSDAEPQMKFDVQVGDEIITVAKRQPSDEYWTGKTRQSFVLGEPTLTILAGAMPAARPVCGTKAGPMRRGPCVAEFRVNCESLWLLKVAEDKKNKKAMIRSQRKEIPKPPARRHDDSTTTNCPKRPPPEVLEGPVEVELLARSEKLTVTIGTAPENRAPASLLVEASFTLDLFGKKNPLKLCDVPLTVVSRSAIRDTYAHELVVRRQAIAMFPDMTFTKNPPKQVAEE